MPVETDFRVVRDERARLRYPVPAVGAETTSRHFDARGPSQQLRHQISIGRRGHTDVRIDVWDDPERLPLGTWFEQHLAFLRGGASSVAPLSMTVANVEGLLIDHPRSPHALGRRTALVSSGARIFRITCLDADDPAAHALFARVVAELAPEELGP